MNIEDIGFVGSVIHGVFDNIPGCRWGGVLHVYEWGFDDFHQSFGFWLTENNQWMVVNHCKE